MIALTSLKQYLDQAALHEQAEQWDEAKALYRHVLSQDFRNETAYLGLIHVLAKERPGHSFGEIYAQEVSMLEAAYHAGLRHPDIVIPLAMTYYQRHDRQKGVSLVEEYLRSETDIAQIRQMLFAATYELHSQIPADYANMLRLQMVFLNEAAVPLSSYDRLYPYLRGAPSDLQDAYFSLGRGDEWFAAVESLWGQLSQHERRELRATYLSITATAYHRAGQHEQVLVRGRQYLRYIRTHTSEPGRSSKLAQTYATLMAQAYYSLGRTTQVTRALRRAEGYLAQYAQVLESNPSLTQGWTDDQFVEPFHNVGFGALQCQKETEALRFFRAAEQARPGVGVVNIFLSALILKVEQDRQESLHHLRRALAAAKAYGAHSVERIQQWFQIMDAFQPVQDDPAFQQLIQAALERSRASTAAATC